MVTTRTGDHTKDGTEAPATAAVGDKHDIEPDSANASPVAKRPKKSDDDAPRQTTLEETLEKKDGQEPKKAEGHEDPDTEMKDQEEKRAAEPEQATQTEEATEEPKEEPKTQESAAEDPKTEGTKTETETAEPETAETETEPKTDDSKAGEAVAKNGDEETAELPHEDKKVPSNVLEKGIVYFFFRARVNTDQPEEVDDIARSYIILRPIGTDSKLGEGPIGDAGNTRLLALPKKVLPQSGRDRFMVFVEKSGASFADLKKNFLAGADNETKAGTSHSPAATPAGEGVYVITTTGRESHLAYMLTLPSDLGEVQKDLGLKEQGSFILSTKNPKFPGPANARLPEDPNFTQEIKDEFRDLRWMPSKPEHLDFVNAQILMIGESSGIKNALEPRKKDIKEGNEEPKEVLEEIEEEDTKRMEELGEDDSGAIFADLQARAKDYPKLQTTF